MEVVRDRASLTTCNSHIDSQMNGLLHCDHIDVPLTDHVQCNSHLGKPYHSGNIVNIHANWDEVDRYSCKERRLTVFVLTL